MGKSFAPGFFSAHRYSHSLGGILAVLRAVGSGAVLGNAGSTPGLHRLEPARPSALRAVLSGAYRRRLPLEPGLQLRLRLPCGAKPKSRAIPYSGARHLAVDPRVKLPAGCDALHGRPVPLHAVWPGIGLHPTHLYGTGLEHGLLRLLVAEKHSTRDAGGRATLPLEPMAEILPTGAAELRHRPDLEFDDVGGRWLVCADGLRDVHLGKSRPASSGAGILFAIGLQCRRLPGDRLGAYRHGGGDCAPGPARLASRHRLEREVQVRAGGGFGYSAFACARFPAPV